MKTQVVNLVRNSSKLYPASATDYEHLHQAGIAIRYIDIGYMRTLSTMSPEIRFKIVKLASLEEAMEEKFVARWPHDFEVTERSVKLGYPRETSQALVDKAVDALQRWYIGHYIALEQTAFKRGKTTRLQFEKRMTI